MVIDFSASLIPQMILKLPTPVLQPYLPESFQIHWGEGLKKETVFFLDT
jgi:hypothetical protein